MRRPGRPRVPQPGAHADRCRHDRGPGGWTAPRRGRLPAEAIRVHRARGPHPGAVPARAARAASGARAPWRAAGSRQARREPRRRGAGARPEGVRGAGAAAGRPGPGRLGRGAAGQGVGRDGRPVHHVGEGHDQSAAPQARRSAGDRDRHPGRLPDRRMTGAPRPPARLVPRRWLRLPRRTVRLRLTLVYGSSFLLSGAALLAITYLLVSRSLPAGPVTAGTSARRAIPPGVMSGGTVFVLVAGRVLRKLRTITAAARSISASNLHARLALAGPDDELTELGDTFDGLLARLEAAFDAQRQFVANASHELRTPLARQRTLIEVALADPEPSVAALRDACSRVLAAGEQQERMIEALLTLARSQRGLDRREPLDLAALTGDVLLACRPEAEQRGLAVAATLGPAPAVGDARLAERLVANLVDNAMRHNVAHGSAQVSTGTVAGCAVLSVFNTGPVIPPQDVARLVRPFQRSGADRTGTSDSLGLGLSIVAAIAEAHGGWLLVSALPGGGLAVQAGFPQAACPARVRSGWPLSCKAAQDDG